MHGTNLGGQSAEVLTFWSVPLCWPRETVFVVGGGTSVTQEMIDRLRGRRVIVINSSYGKAPWADYLIFSDHLWYEHHRANVKAEFRGEIVNASIGIKCEAGLHKIKRRTKALDMADPTSVFIVYTSFTAAISVAANLIGGGGTIVLLGADGRVGAGGKTHHHEPHPWPQLPGLWQLHHDDLAQCVAPLRARGIEVVNASPGTAWGDLWQETTLDKVLANGHAAQSKPPFLVRGMHGMGDNLHMRALVRKMMQTRTVYLETTWASLYHDLVAEGLRVVEKETPLRTQKKNAIRERNLFWKGKIPGGIPARQVSYVSSAVRTQGSVVGAMLASFGLDPKDADFRLPVPQAWIDGIDKIIGKPTKPILVYRPLVVRREWYFYGRNPEINAYKQIFDEHLRDRYFVVSIADIVDRHPKGPRDPDEEWIVSHPIKADREFHKGELPFEMLAALFKRAALVYTSPGFSVPLSQAVGTPVICMFGGYENSKSFSGGARFAPYLGLDVIHPCSCFSHSHKCDKRIDVAKASAQTKAFIDALADHHESGNPAWPVDVPAHSEIFEPGGDRGASFADRRREAARNARIRC